MIKGYSYNQNGYKRIGAKKFKDEQHFSSWVLLMEKCYGWLFTEVYDCDDDEDEFDEGEDFSGEETYWDNVATCAERFSGDYHY